MHVFILRALSRGNTSATSCKELTHWKIPWCWEGFGAGEGDDRGWDGWMASLTQWTWVWVNSRSWWWTGRPGMLWFMGLQSRTWQSDWTEDYSRMKSAYSKNFWPKHYQHTPINYHNDHPYEGKKKCPLFKPGSQQNSVTAIWTKAARYQATRVSPTPASQSLLKSLELANPKPVYRLPSWLSGKESACQAGDLGLIPGLGRFHGEGNGNSLQYSCLENPTDRRAWRAIVHGGHKESDTT